MLSRYKEKSVSRMFEKTEIEFPFPLCLFVCLSVFCLFACFYTSISP